MGFFSKKQLFRDLILILVCLLIAGGVALVLRLTRTEGAFVVVTLMATGSDESRELGRYPLGTDAEIPLTFPGGTHNTLVIRDGAVCMTDADCPDRLCVKQGAIRYTGQTIVCLPHRLVVRIMGAGDGVDLSAAVFPASDRGTAGCSAVACPASDRPAADLSSAVPLRNGGEHDE